MLINEIFDTKPDVDWKETDSGWRGKFILDEHEYEIHLDEFTLKLSKDMSLVDLGFTREGSWKLAGGKTSAAKVFGALFNISVPKLKLLNPDIIVFGVHNKNGDVESRKSLYSRLASWYSRGSQYNSVFGAEWITTPNGQYCALSSVSLSDKDKEEVKKFAASIIEK